jgi:hypothetical protein
MVWEGATKAGFPHEPDDALSVLLGQGPRVGLGPDRLIRQDSSHGLNTDRTPAAPVQVTFIKHRRTQSHDQGAAAVRSASPGRTPASFPTSGPLHLALRVFGCARVFSWCISCIVSLMCALNAGWLTVTST